MNNNINLEHNCVGHNCVGHNCVEHNCVEQYSDTLQAALGSYHICETHISVVLVGETLVLKLKKPVDFGFLDYSTLEKRWEAVIEEVLLNRRLSSDIYLGAISLPLSDSSALEDAVITNPKRGSALPEGCTEVAVLMRRVDDKALLSQKLSNDEVSANDVRKIASRISGFHQECRLTNADSKKLRESAFSAVAENISVLHSVSDSVISTNEKRALEIVESFTDAFSKNSSDLLEARFQNGFGVDGHADLRAEHIALENGAISVLDCVEFNSSLRACDALSDIAFLCMDLERLGRADLSSILIESYASDFSGVMDKALFNFYRCYRAMVRAKVAALKAAQEHSEQALSNPKAVFAKFLGLASRYALQLDGPLLIAVGGKIGSGKSTLSEALAACSGAESIQADLVRREIYPDEAFANQDSVSTGKYSEEGKQKVYDVCLSRVEHILAHNGIAIFDCSFSTSALRAQTRKLALSAGARCVFVLCELERKETIKRLRTREQDATAASEGRAEIYDRLALAFEEPTSNEEIIRVNTSSPLDAQVTLVRKEF